MRNGLTPPPRPRPAAPGLDYRSLPAVGPDGSRPVARLYHNDLIFKTGNFASTSWLGVPIWQNVLDVWTIQETISDVRPGLLIELKHPRVTFLHGSSTDPAIVEQVQEAVSTTEGPVMVILDGNHDRDHVAKELELYAPFVTPGSYLLSQDGVIYKIGLFRDSRPGPLPANRDFLARHTEFEYDREGNERFRLTHHPLGWMRRR
jgi:cephalosporin hydroxylase